MKITFTSVQQHSINNKKMSVCNVSVNLSHSHMKGYHSILPLPFSFGRGIFLVSQIKPSADFTESSPAIWFPHFVLHTRCSTLYSASAPTLQRTLRKLFPSPHVVPHWKHGNSSNSGTWDVTQVTHHSMASNPKAWPRSCASIFYYIWDGKFRHSSKTTAKIWTSYFYFLISYGYQSHIQHTHTHTHTHTKTHCFIM